MEKAGGTLRSERDQPRAGAARRRRRDRRRAGGASARRSAPPGWCRTPAAGWSRALPPLSEVEAALPRVPSARREEGPAVPPGIVVLGSGGLRRPSRAPTGSTAAFARTDVFRTAADVEAGTAALATVQLSKHLAARQRRAGAARLRPRPAGPGRAAGRGPAGPVRARRRAVRRPAAHPGRDAAACSPTTTCRSASPTRSTFLLTS